MVLAKKIIGIVENITLLSAKKKKRVKAKIDTGATNSSIDVKLAKELKLGPVIKSKLIKSSLGNMRRPIIEATIIIKGKRTKAEFTIADRSHLKYDVLIGQNALKEGFLIDPSKK